MNILIIIRSAESNVGGVEMVSFMLANKFLSEKHNVSFFTFENRCINLQDYLNPNIKLYIGHGYNFSQKNIETMRNILLSDKINIVINQWGLPYIPIKIIKGASINLSLKIISVYHNDPLSNGRIKSIDIKLLQKHNCLYKNILLLQKKIVTLVTSNSMKYVYNNSDKYIVLSESYIDNFKMFTKLRQPSKLMVLTNPITINHKPKSYENINKRKEIIYVGRLDYIQKRVDRIVEVWGLLEKKLPDWKLSIIGEGNEREKLENLVREKKLKNIFFVGFKNPEPFYKRASILLLTSEFEGFPLVLTECMSFGVVPFVYGSYSAVYDIIKHGNNGMILPYNKNGFNAELMAKELYDITLNNSKLESMSLQAIKTSKMYEIDTIYELWKNLFLELEK